jgi:hypothetical protein
VQVWPVTYPCSYSSLLPSQCWSQVLILKKKWIFDWKEASSIVHGRRASRISNYWVDRSVNPSGLVMFWIVFRNKVSDRVKQRGRGPKLQVLDNPWRVLFCNRVEYRREKNKDRSVPATPAQHQEVSSVEGKRTERFSEKSSRYRDSLKSEVRLPRD